MKSIFEKLAYLFIRYYPPIEVVEHKYHTKVTAVGILKTAGFEQSAYFYPYYQRMLSYKLLVKDYTDNMKFSIEATSTILKKMISSILNGVDKFETKSMESLDIFISLIYPKLPVEYELRKIRSAFLKKFNCHQGINLLTRVILKNYFSSGESYDRLAQHIVKKCLTGIKQEDIHNKLSKATYNYIIYSLRSDVEKAFIYEVYLKRNEETIPKKFFRNLPAMTRAIINEVGPYRSTVNFFGSLINSYGEIKELFSKNLNITVMFF